MRPRSPSCVCAAVILVGLAVATPAASQVRRDSIISDSLRAVGDSLLAQDSLLRVDTALAATIGLPTAPSRTFPSADSILSALLEREGYSATRYAADSLTFFAVTSEIELEGSTLLEREGMTLEAGSVRFRQQQCALDADGQPTMFEGGTVMIGEQMAYNTCEQQALVAGALTEFNQSGVDWYLRGGLGIDSAATRLYAGSGEITSCDLAESHYHFQAGKVKWVSNSFMVARPAKLYVRDVPVMWLPFLFQDMRQGRRSGMLTPRFGISDIIRPNEGYRRHITNIGYYVALSDYFDVQASLDWFARTSVSLNGQVRYRWLDRFVSGGISVSRIFESGQDGERGRRSLRLAWNHQQSFNQRTRLTANVDFATSSSVIERNSIDPFLQTATLQSSLNYSKQTSWGTINIGGRARQDLSNDEVTLALPDMRLTPVPISLARDITWSPSIAFSNNRTLNQRVGLVDLPPVNGELPDPDTLFADSRNTSLNVATPIRFGRWNWQNSFSITDVFDDRRNVQTLPDPDDTTQTVTRVFSENFETRIDWNTGINLPLLFPSSWKLQPSVGIRNATSGPFMLRNRFTGGQFVQQGKRVDFGASVSPTLFGFFPGIGPLERIRHSFSPQIRWNYAPSASVPEAYARAINPRAATPNLMSPAVHQVSVGFSNTFEGKFETEGDTTDTRNAPKLKILNIQTSSISYDFEQAKEPGRTGWTTQNITNSFTSDLLRGFSFRTVHDLWEGQAGVDTSRFSPFLRSVSARFTLTGQTISRLIGAITGGGEPLGPPDPNDLDTALTQPYGVGAVPGRGTSFPGLESYGRGPVRGQGFSASLTYDEQRQRVAPDTEEDPLAPPSTNRTLGYSLSFSPTEHWSLSWTSQYNFTTKEFGQHVLRFDRDLHRWRATFSVVSAPNGNFAFNFFINLLDQPEIKFNYDQRSVN